MELGKDVVALDPSGDSVAFQLKGNPGSRFSLRQFREIQQQLWELATLKIPHPAIPTRRHHKSFLVTNGEVDEEALRALEDLNGAFAMAQNPGRIEIISRGQLLRWALDLGPQLWPTEIADIGALLSTMGSRGDNAFPSLALHQLLTKLLCIDAPRGARPKAPDFRRRIASAAVLTEVSLYAFRVKSNHLACLTAWLMYAFYIIAACSRHELSFQRNAQHSFTLAKTEVFDCLGDLCEEVMENPRCLQGDPWTEFAALQWRKSLVFSFLAAYRLWIERERICHDRVDRHMLFLDTFLPRTCVNTIALWGEGAIPQWLALYLCNRRRDRTQVPDAELIALLKAVLTLNAPGSDSALANPYYGYEDVLRSVLPIPVVEHRTYIFEDDSFAGESWFANSLFELLARQNLKQTCKGTWKKFSRIGHKHFKSDASWQYCLLKCEQGREVLTQPRPTESWDNVLRQLRRSATDFAPPEVTDEPILLLLFHILFPYRASPDAVLHVSRSLTKGWY